MDKWKLNIDGGLEELDGYHTWAPFKPSGVSTVHANHIVIQRFFERLKDPHFFLTELPFIAVGDTELYVFLMDHDGVQSYIGRGREYLQKAFGKKCDEYGYWIRNYSVQEAISVFEEYGWEYQGPFTEVDNIKPEYPHHKLKFKLRRGRAAWDYALEGMDIPKSDKMLDIGPGNYPWPLANYTLEHPSRKTHPAYKPDQIPKENVFWGDIQQVNGDIPDKFFDFALCSHVFEHLSNPVAAAEELSRIAKRGVVIVPSAYKDMMAMWDEQEHLWDCYPGTFQTLQMKARNTAQMAAIRDKQMQTVMNRLFHGVDFQTSDLRYAKKWFHKNEKNLDIIIPWEGYFEVQLL